MAWNNPPSGWMWLLFAAPTVEVMLIPLVAKRLGDIFFPHDEIPELTFLVYNLIMALALSMALGLRLAWPKTDWAKRISWGLAWGLAIASLNAGVAFAGCAILSS